MEEGKVKMYVCGPTVYDYIHIGNARPYVVFDTVRRYLEYKGYEVTYVQNFTDVDDKIINRANKEGKTMAEISNKYIEEAFRDADGLNVKRATVHPRVTEEMDGIIAMVQTLIDKGFAYEDHGTVYYDTKKFPEYGKLSRKNLDELIAGASERVTIDDAKKNPTDFVLWKPKKEGEPSWTSPWGEGRPGWHIECSVMSKHHLGDTFDIHAGGVLFIIQCSQCGRILLYRYNLACQLFLILYTGSCCYDEHLTVIHIGLGPGVGILSAVHGEPVPDTVNGSGRKLHILCIPVNGLFYQFPALSLAYFRCQIQVKAYIFSIVITISVRGKFRIKAYGKCLIRSFRTTAGKNTCCHADRQ